MSRPIHHLTDAVLAHIVDRSTSATDQDRADAQAELERRHSLAQAFTEATSSQPTPCPWTDVEECAAARERSVAGTGAPIPLCATHYDPPALVAERIRAWRVPTTLAPEAEAIAETQE